MEGIIMETKKELEKAKDYLAFYNSDYLELLRTVYTDAYDRSHNEDYYISYYNIVKRTAELMDKMKIKETPMLINLTFEYLLWGGYLSKNHQLVYRMKGRINNFSCVGADIMRGYSVCLNNAEMLSKIYCELGFESHTIGCSVTNVNAKDIQYRPDINRAFDKNSFIGSLFLKYLGLAIGPLFGNHAVTLVKENGIYQLYDPTNLSVIHLKDFMKAHFIGSDRLFDLKAWIMLLVEEMSNEEFKDFVCSALVSGKYRVKVFPFESYKDISEQYLQLLKQEELMLERFYESNEKDIDIVAKKLVNGRK